MRKDGIRQVGIPRLPGMTTSYPKLKRVRGAQRKAAQSDAVSRRRTAIPLVSAIFYAQKVNAEDSDSTVNINLPMFPQAKLAPPVGTKLYQYTIN